MNSIRLGPVVCALASWKSKISMFSAKNKISVWELQKLIVPPKIGNFKFLDANLKERGREEKRTPLESDEKNNWAIVILGRRKERKIQK